MRSGIGTGVTDWTRACKQLIPPRYLYDGRGQVLAQVFVIGQELVNYTYTETQVFVIGQELVNCQYSQDIFMKGEVRYSHKCF